MKKILVTGSNGQLGSELKALSGVNESPFAFTFIDIEQLDLTQQEQVQAYVSANRFDYIIHGAAYTAVDKAETEVELCTRVNSDAVGVIARAAQANGSRLIYISTDYIFDGEFNQPVQETATPNPLSVYGRTKLEGERHVRMLKDAYTIRTSWVYSTFGKNFVKSIISLCKSRNELTVVADQYGSPTYARDLAQTIISIITSVDSKRVDIPGVYHFSNEGTSTWYDFAYYIKEYFGYPCVIRPIPTSEYKTAALRPKFAVLDKSKIRNNFGIEIAHWSSSLRDCLSKIEV